MDFAAEEELCQQAYEVWLHYAGPPTVDGEGGSSPRLRPLPPAPPASTEGPCSVLPLVFSPSGACYLDASFSSRAAARRKAQ